LVSGCLGLPGSCAFAPMSRGHLRGAAKHLSGDCL
jgi:hypothetical protein